MANPLSGLKDWFDKLSPAAKEAMIAGGFNAAGSFLEGRAVAGENKATREQSAATNMADLERGFLQTDRQGAQSVMGQTQMGEIPSTYASLAMRRALFEGLDPNATFGNVGGVTNVPPEFASKMATLGGPSLGGTRDMAMKYLSEDALQADLARRLSAEGRVDPNGQTFDMTSIWGAGAQPEMDSVNQLKTNTSQFIDKSQDRTRQALQSALSGQRPGQAAGQQQQRGTPWWKKALGVGLGAAGLIAAPFTGGVSTALIGAGGALAGSKLMGGSNQDALMAALGAGASSALGARGGGKPTQPQYRTGRVPNVTFGGR